jgi:hypothetical protein
MKVKQNPAPRANAGSRANSKVHDKSQFIASAIDREANPAVIWLAMRFPIPTMFARILAALASLGRAFQ